MLEEKLCQFLADKYIISNLCHPRNSNVLRGFNFVNGLKCKFLQGFNFADQSKNVNFWTYSKYYNKARIKYIFYQVAFRLEKYIKFIK